MSKTCVIFDVDGTLIDSNEFDSRLYTTAIRDVLGNDVLIRPRWIDYRHVTDAGILRELCGENGIDPASCEARVRTRFGEIGFRISEIEGCLRPNPRRGLPSYRTLLSPGRPRRNRNGRMGTYRPVEAEFSGLRVTNSAPEDL